MTAWHDGAPFDARDVVGVLSIGQTTKSKDQIGFFGHVSPEQVAIWFGVTFCMNMQVSFLSPPFGPAAFYLKSVAPENITLTAIFAGFMPFIAIQVIALAVILCWPPIIAVFL